MKVNIAIVGATGMVGRTFIKVLEEMKFPIKNIYFFASAKSKGTKVTFNSQEYEVEELTEESFDRNIDIALFSAGGEISKKFAPIAKSKGAIVIDNSSAWRMNEEVPLIVPEVNPQDINWNNGIIANPNCSTIQCMQPLKLLKDRYGIKRIVYSTYQAVSGSGIGGLKDLENGIKGEKNTKYPHQIAYNCIPHVDVFLENGYTKEEIKMINETRKILGDQDIKITSTAVRVPVKYGHCVSINVELEKSFDIEEVKAIYRESEGIILQDDVSNNVYPMPLTIEGTDEVYIGRIRRDYSVDNGLNLWVCADNARKGAATNAVQIAQLLLDKL
ncbi:aspartate-semialdehyde dehydrogenase [Clostridiaceae bacterium M8S5]|nr:aspartate-semialdehyde dehydrogenase [Clostridiaceae bacterium M8S5]